MFSLAFGICAIKALAPCKSQSRVFTTEVDHNMGVSQNRVPQLVYLGFLLSMTISLQGRVP